MLITLSSFIGAATVVCTTPKGFSWNSPIISGPQAAFMAAKFVVISIAADILQYEVLGISPITLYGKHSSIIQRVSDSVDAMVNSFSGDVEEDWKNEFTTEEYIKILRFFGRHEEAEKLANPQPVTYEIVENWHSFGSKAFSVMKAAYELSVYGVSSVISGAKTAASYTYESTANIFMEMLKHDNAEINNFEGEEIIFAEQGGNFNCTDSSLADYYYQPIDNDTTIATGNDIIIVDAVAATLIPL